MTYTFPLTHSAPRAPETLGALLATRAATHPEEGYAFLVQGDVDGHIDHLTFRELHQRALAVGARLDRAGARGERVMLVFAPGLEFLVGLLGCLVSGAVAVPVYPPNPSRLQKTLPLMATIAADARARFALTSPELLPMAAALGPMAADLAGLEWLSTAGGDGSDWTPPAIHADDLAFLQYTSGSTGQPKGVMLRHRNLLANEAMIAASFGQKPHGRVVGWLPLYHDMGLIGNILCPLYCGGSAWLMSPMHFIKRPMVWLEAIDRFRAYTSGGPNFAYDLCVDRLDPHVLRRLDLSCWKVAFNGAEPIRAETLERFTRTFAPAGFAPTAPMPCYGLAESTLAVTCTPLSAPPRIVHADPTALEAGRFVPTIAGAGLPLVSSGLPVPGGEVVIIDPAVGTPANPGEVGEICVRGPHVAAGYWDKPTQSAQTFGFILPGDPHGTWLRTGDLGFFDGGELYVCGRQKDLIIVRGRNLYPHDLERAVCEAHPSIRAGCVVAFGTDREEVVIVAELTDRADPGRSPEVVGCIRQALGADFGIRPREVVLVGSRTLPKTSSGKLRRSATRQAWAAGQLDTPIHADTQQTEAPADDLEARVHSIVARILGVPELVASDDFFRLGADSITLAAAAAEVEALVGYRIPLEAVLDAPSVSKLTAWLRTQASETAAAAAPPRTLPLNADMRRLVALAGPAADALHLAAAFVLRNLHPAFAHARLQAAIQRFATRHAALRTAFVRTESGEVVQRVSPSSLRVTVDASTGAVRPQLDALVQAPFDLSCAPLWRFALVQPPDSDPVLCVVAHHLVADHASFRQLVGELEADLRSALPATATDDDALGTLARSEASGRSVDVSGVEPLAFSTLCSRPPDAGDRAASLFVPLPPATHDRIDRLARSLGVLPAAVGLAALELLLHRICGVTRFVVGVPIDRRMALGAADAVGFFSVPVLVPCEVHLDEHPSELVARAQLQLREAMAAPGLDATAAAGLARALGRTPGMPLLQVLFNALTVAPRAPQEIRLERLPLGPAALDVDISLSLVRSAAESTVEVHFRREVLDLDAADRLVEAYVAVLELLAAEAPIRALAWPAAIPGAQAARPIAIAATFSIEPLRPLVAAWGRTLETRYTVDLAEHGQVLAPLWSPSSPLRGGAPRVVLVRVCDVFRARATIPTEAELRGWMGELIAALRAAVSSTPLFVAVAPSAPDPSFAAVSADLCDALDRIDGITRLDTEALFAGLTLDAVLDPGADRLAEMPYTPAAYAALATGIVRAVWRAEEPAPKLIAIDADQSLWADVLGEVGPEGIDPAPFAVLHQRLAAAREAGILLALVSNNDPDLLHAALERPDLPDAASFVAVDGGYGAKADRLIRMADGLSLGLDSFCFLDDNPVEIAAVRAACPEVLAIQLPEPAAIDGFARRLWALDARSCTSADRARAQRYAQELARQRSRVDGQDHVEFVQGLALVVTTHPVQMHQNRAAQLTARTNQFTLRKRVMTAEALGALVDQDGVASAVLEVRDRFGDYGIVGLVVARTSGDTLAVDTLLLSCRVLGRGVEREVLHWLATEAESRRLRTVTLAAEITPRNAPARRFVARLAAAVGAADPLRAELSVPQLRTITLPMLLECGEPTPSNARRADLDRRTLSRKLTWIARNLHSGRDVLDAFGLSAGARRTERGHTEGLIDDIARRMAALLGLERLDADASFLDSGASSIVCVQLLSELERDRNLSLTLEDLIGAPSARALARVATGQVARPEPLGGAGLLRQLTADAQLDPALMPAPTTGSWTAPRRVLLTGATGFVGAHLLFELLRHTDATVVCLIRARAEDHGWQRLREAIERVELTWSPVVQRRVEVLIGDLAAPKLGLDEATWYREARALDAIYHCGAAVNFAQPYAQQRGPNVEGTRSILELACAERASAVHHVSTMGVHIGDRCQERQVLDEVSPLGSPAALPLGYQQSKWVAERLVLEASARGLPVTIYRPGSIGPHSVTGVHNADDLFVLTLRASERVRALPRSRALDTVPVDWIASMIASVACDPQAEGRVLSLTHPHPVPFETLIDWFQLGGSAMRVCGLDDWIERVRADLGEAPDHPLAVLRPVLESAIGRRFFALINQAPPADCTTASAFARQHGLACPPLDIAQLQRWGRRLRKEGLIEEPRGAEGAVRRYLWFNETLRGTACGPDGRADTLNLDLVASVSSLRAMIEDRRIDLAGTVSCPALHPRPLQVRTGTWHVRPHAGLGRQKSSEATLMEISLELVAPDGCTFWLEGTKVARPRLDVWRQARTFEVRAGDARGLLVTGKTEVPGEAWIEDQVYGVQFDPCVPEGERRRARLIYLGWLCGNIGRTYYDLALRLGTSIMRGV